MMNVGRMRRGKAAETKAETYKSLSHSFPTSNPTLPHTGGGRLEYAAVREEGRV